MLNLISLAHLALIVSGKLITPKHHQPAFVYGIFLHYSVGPPLKTQEKDFHLGIDS